MKKLIVLAALLLIGLVAWRVGGRLSSDALGMGLGVLFGVLAGVPTAMLMMASGRRRDEPTDQGRGQGQMRQGQGQPPYGYPQPPVIVLAGHGAPAQGNAQNMYGDQYQQPRQPGLLPGPPETVEARQFRVVGEKEEWVDEW